LSSAKTLPNTCDALSLLFNGLVALSPSCPYQSGCFIVGGTKPISIFQLSVRFDQDTESTNLTRLSEADPIKWLVISDGTNDSQSWSSAKKKVANVCPHARTSDERSINFSN
jgi:hypothetical protein